ncbi:hypothetical protein DYB31_008644 [Aphanomyces astaci]|uniref:protein-histidine N-methyltransferase n=1 Tax=Aphanomyces astaci TaxID=112090 RepID=A0A397G206_APHAT|nr:hypothetical protein DYB31_008644 [Aphanomyces astaci]
MLLHFKLYMHEPNGVAAATLRELTAVLGVCTSWKDLNDVTVLNKLVALSGTLRSLERCSSIVGDDDVATSTSAATLAAFQAWLEEGMQVPVGQGKFNVEQMGDHGNGLRARVDLPQGVPIMSIPATLLLTSSSLPPALAHLRQDPLCRQFPTVSLALRVLHEALTPSSFFAPYVAVLPRQMHLPLQYTVADFAALASSASAYASAIQLFYNALRQYLYLHRHFHQQPTIFRHESFSLTNYFWALSVALTRQNNVPTPDDPSALALIPGWDMCNHAIGDMTTYSDSVSIHCDAMTSFAPGDEITICYGPRPNADLLVYSGFSLSHNPYNGPVSLVLPLLDQKLDPLVKLRTMLLQKRNATISANGVHVQLDAQSGRLTSRLYREQVQLLVLDKPSLAIALRRDVDKINTPSMESISNGKEGGHEQHLIPWPDQETMDKANRRLQDACAAAILSIKHSNETIHESIRAFLATERRVYELAKSHVVEFKP